jgi:hypothetical protein
VNKHTTFRKLLKERLAIGQALQTELDKLVPPTPTGYLRANEHWKVVYVAPGEGPVELEIAIEPPDGAYEWRSPRAQQLNTLQALLGCDDIYVKAIGGPHYIAYYNKT